MTTPSISIIIPSKDRLDLLQQCVASVRQHCRGNYEIIVVDTGSGEEFVWAGANGCRALGLPKATFAQANNEAAKIARGDHLLLLNNDVILQSDPWSEFYPTNEIMGYRLLYPNGLVQHAGVGFDMDGNPYHLWHNAPAEHPEVMESYGVNAVTFAAVMIPKHVWELVNGLDEAFQNAYEDIDFCLHAREKGVGILYWSPPQITHLTGQTAGRHDHVKESWEYFHAKWIASGRLSAVTGVYPFSVGAA